MPGGSQLKGMPVKTNTKKVSLPTRGYILHIQHKFDVVDAPRGGLYGSVSTFCVTETKTHETMHTCHARKTVGAMIP